MKTVIEVREDGLAYVVNGQERILCADQTQAWTLAEPTGPGIYPIPDLQYEVNYVPIERDAATYSHYEREAEKQLVTEFKKLAVLL